MSGENSEGRRSLESEQLSLLVADVAGYSELDEFELQRFFERALNDIASELDERSPRESNTWGDGVIAYFDDPKSAAKCALGIRDTFRNTSWQSIGIPDLSIRVALHTATVFVGHNPVRDSEGIVGTDVNLAARIEPVVTPDHVFTTELFRESLKNQLHEETNLAFDELYETELAKGWGEEVLFNLRRRSEKEISPEMVARSSRATQGEDESQVEALKQAFLESSEVNVEQQKKAVDILVDRGGVEAIEPLSDALTDSETLRADVRARIAHRLGDFNDSRVMDDLITTITEDRNQPVVNSAVGTLGELGNVQAMEVLKQVVENEEDYSDRVRHTAALSLADLEDADAVSVLSRVLRDEDDSEKVRRGAAQALSDLEDTETLKPLIEALDAPEEHVRGIAIRALGSLGQKEAIEPLRELLTDPEGTKKDIRIACVKSLVEIEEPEVVEPLTTALDDPSRDVQAQAIKGLGDLGATEALDRLEERLRNEEAAPNIRAAAAYSIGEIGDPKAAAILVERARKDQSIEVRKSSLAAIAKIEPITVIDDLCELVRDEETIADVRDATALALGRMGYVEALDAVTDAIDDPVVEVQRSAIEAASDIGGEKAVQKLSEILTDSDEYPVAVRAMAATQIRHFEDRRVSDALIDTLRSGDDARVRRISALVLGRTGSTEVTELLEDIAADKSGDFDVRLAAVWSLGVISDPDSESLFVDIIEDEEEPWRIRRRATVGLGGLGTQTSRNKLEEFVGTIDLPSKLGVTAQEVLSRSAEENRERLKNELDEGDW